MNKKFVVTFVGLVFLLMPLVSSASTFELAKESQVNFVAKITGSSFKGECETVTGTATLDAEGKKLTSIEWALKAEDIKTGMDQRDGHMYKKYLKTKDLVMLVIIRNYYPVQCINHKIQTQRPI